MNLLYLDEQTAFINELEFTAVSGIIVSSEKLESLRCSIYLCLIERLGLRRVAEIDGAVTLKEMPILHGVDFLRTYSDDIKLACLQDIVNFLCASDFKCVRMGYFHDSLVGCGSPDLKNQAIDLALLSVWLAMEQVAGDFLVISEIDKEGLKRNFRSLSSNMGLYYAIGSASISVDFRRMLGHVFGLKSDIGCQIADIVSYICLKHVVSKGGFGKEFGSFQERFQNRFLINEIVYANDPKKSIKFHQSYDNPLRSFFHITPTD